MVDIRPPVLPIRPLPSVAVKSQPPKAVVNLPKRTPTSVRVMHEGLPLSSCQNLGIALPNTALAPKIHHPKFPKA